MSMRPTPSRRARSPAVYCGRPGAAAVGGRLDGERVGPEVLADHPALALAEERGAERLVDGGDVALAGEARSRCRTTIMTGAAP